MALISVNSAGDEDFDTKNPVDKKIRGMELVTGCCKLRNGTLEDFATDCFILQ